MISFSNLLNKNSRASMFRTFFAFSLVVVSLALYQGPVRAENGYKNLKVYPGDVDKKVLKNDMKSYAKALGVKCDGCHDTSAFETDTKMKKEAREMIRMTRSINKRLKKDGFKDSISCNTCHQGKEHPTK